MQYSMRRIAPWWCWLSAFVVGLVLTVGVAAEVNTTPVTIIVVRHAEKDTVPGVEDVPLTAAGRDRAKELARVLTAAGVTHVFTSDRLRTQQTAAPLAKQGGIASTPIKELKALVSELKNLKSGSVALVVQHSNTIGQVLKDLGATNTVTIAENEFDRMFVLTRDAQGRWSIVELRYGPVNAPLVPATKQ